MPALLNFVDKQPPAVPAAWLNIVDVIVTAVLQQAQTNPAVRAALMSDLPLEIVNGGTGGRTGPAARASLTFDLPLEISNGGTGARTQAAALLALGAASNIQTTQAELAAGYAAVNTNYLPGYPERYVPLANLPIVYSDTAGILPLAPAANGVTDFTGPLNIALNIPGQPAYLGPNNYRVSNLILNPGSTLIGCGRWNSNLICPPTATGTFMGGPTGAQKIRLTGWQVYGNLAAYNHGVYLGYGSVVYGTEAYLDDLMVRDMPNCPGLDIKANVGESGFISTNNTQGLNFIGTGCSLNQTEVVGCSGFTVGGLQTVANFQDISIGFYYEEAAANGTAPLTLSGNASVGMVTISFSPFAVHPNAITIGASATTVTIGNIKYYFHFSSGVLQPPNITGGNIYDAGTNSYYGGNATGGSHNGEGALFAGKGGALGTVIVGGATFGILGTAVSTILKGSQAMSGTTQPVNFGVTLPTATYQILLSPNGTGSNIGWSSKTQSGFTLTAAPTFSGTVDWTIVQ